MAIPSSSSRTATRTDVSSTKQKKVRGPPGAMGMLTRKLSTRKLSDSTLPLESSHSSISIHISTNSISCESSTTDQQQQQQQQQEPETPSTTSRRGLLLRSPGSLRDFNSCSTDNGSESGAAAAPEQRLRRMFRRNSTTTTSSRNLNQMAKAGSKKRVRFAPEEQLAVVSVVLPKRSERELARMFYSEAEISKQKAECKRLAEEVAWKTNDSCNVLACLHFLYGWKSASPSSVQQTRRMSNNASTTTTTTAGSNGLTKEHALTFLYSYKVTEDDGTRATIRGLEREMSLKISDQRSATIQAVLSMQLKLKDTSVSSGQRSSKESPEEKLAQVAMAASAGAQRFARVLGKADRAVTKGSGGVSK